MFSTLSVKIDWFWVLAVFSVVWIGLFTCAIIHVSRKAAKKRAEAARVVEEARRRHEIEHGLRQRNEYDKPVTQSAWTPSIMVKASWAFGNRQELLPNDIVLQFEIPFGAIDLHFHRGIAIERGGKIVAEYSGFDLDLPHIMLPKSDQTAPPKLEKSYPALEALAKDMSQTQVTKEKLASMILDKQQLQQAEKSGQVLNNEEQKRLFLLKCLLGGDGLQPAFETRTLSLDEADKFNAVGRFSFGQVRTLLLGQGNSQGDVSRFLERIQNGELSSEEASQFLSDCEEWQQIMANTQESRKAFFARKRAERQETKRNDPARN